MRQNWRDNKEIVRELLSRCTSYSEVLRHLGLGHSGNASTLKKYMKLWGFTFERYLGCAHGSPRNRLQLSDCCVENSTYSRSSLKPRLIQEGLLEEKCFRCGNTGQWLGEPLVLILDHINGVNNDHRLGNLRLVCPNCNTQLPTFAGRKNKKEEKAKRKSRSGEYTRKLVRVKVVHRCGDCGKEVRKQNTRCWECFGLSQRKQPWPLSEELQGLLWKYPTTRIAEMHGVSDKTVEKWVKRLGLEKPSRGYWSIRRGKRIGDRTTVEM